jgi:PBP1b-binding outer membrane lipoprotein LpoB
VTTHKALLVLTAAALLITGCSGSESESTPAAPAESTVSASDMSDVQAPPQRLTIDVSIAGGEVKPLNEQLQATVNQPIIVKVTSDTEDELHVHSNPEHTFAVKSGPAQTFQFTVAVPGRVDIELHNAGKTVATIAVQ